TNATDVYLFRQVNGTWYKVKTIALSDFLIADPLARIDDTSDIEAEDLDIFQDPNYVAANTILDSDPALAIIGPIEGRWLYFTAKFIYFSEINNPTYIDTVKTVKSIASTLETFYWAKQVDADTILVGTSNDIYKLYGTFITLPDNTVDVYYKPLNTTYRPVSKNATEYNNSVIYLATSGWRIADVSGASISLVGDKLDLLYQGETPNGITAPSFTSPDFPCCVVKDKFYAAVNTTASTQRIEVYDFTRKYWHTRIDSTNDVTAFLALTPNGILAGINNSTDGSKIVTYDDPAGTNSLAVSIETLYFDLQAPRNRKDLFTFKARIAANDTVTFSLTDEAGTAHAIGTMAPASTSIKELFLDLSTLDPIKYAKLAITCTTDYFKLDDFSIDFEVRPTPITFFKKYSQNFGSASKKRLRVWPVVIDTLGHDVTYTPIVDGTSETTITLNSTGKRTLLPQIVTDFFGIDYDYELLGTNEFEYWEDVTPEIVQVLPIAKRFDQVGPEELFRYGVIKRIEVRVLPIDGGSGATLDLPWKIYFQDTSVATGNFEVTEGVEGSYFIGVPKGTSGQVIRIELGPTTWDFHRYYMMALVMKSGRDTDNEWIPLGVNPNG
ncbi:MAG: hypothetical protein ACREHG_08035, partial [Candidatus Saccharimonadales bacterium]